MLLKVSNTNLKLHSLRKLKAEFFLPTRIVKPVHTRIARLITKFIIKELEDEKKDSVINFPISKLHNLTLDGDFRLIIRNEKQEIPIMLYRDQRKTEKEIKSEILEKIFHSCYCLEKVLADEKYYLSIRPNFRYILRRHNNENEDIQMTQEGKAVLNALKNSFLSVI